MGLITSVPVHCLSFTICHWCRADENTKIFSSSLSQNAKESKSLRSDYGIRTKLYHRLLFLFYQYLHKLWDILKPKVTHLEKILRAALFVMYYNLVFILHLFGSCFILDYIL